MSAECIGILPAAGVASRLSPSRYLKELLPVTYLVDHRERTAKPIPVIALSLCAMAANGIKRCVVVISDRKPDLFRYLGDGSDFGVELAYVQQQTPRGLAEAVALTRSWIGDSMSCLLLPDTIVRPEQALSRTLDLVRSGSSSIALSVFPTAFPEQLGPVRFDEAGEIKEILDKPASTDLQNTWGQAVWNPQFSDFLSRRLALTSGAASLGQVLEEARQSGLVAKANYVADGTFVDAGTFQGISNLAQGIDISSNDFMN